MYGTNQSAHPHNLISVLVFFLRKMGPLATHRSPIKDTDQTAPVGSAVAQLVEHYEDRRVVSLRLTTGKVTGLCP